MLIAPSFFILTSLATNAVGSYVRLHQSTPCASSVLFAPSLSVCRHRPLPVSHTSSVLGMRATSRNNTSRVGVALAMSVGLSESDNRSCFETEGYLSLANLIPSEKVKIYGERLWQEALRGGEPYRHGAKGTFFDQISSAAYDLARDSQVLTAVQAQIQQTPVLFRCTLIDKSPGGAWRTSWHQDHPERFILHGLRNRGLIALEHDAVSNTEIEKRMSEVEGSIVTVHIHIDKSDQVSGCLKMIAGSHLEGTLSTRQLTQIADQSTISYCEAGPGDVVLMNPKTVHGSDQNQSQHHRRILHLEFIGEEALSQITQS